MPEKFDIKIGDITIGIDWIGRSRNLEIPSAYQPFVGNDEPDLRLELHMGFPDYRIGEKVFDSAPVWSLHRNANKSAIKISHNHAELKRILCLPGEFTVAGLHFVGPEGRFLDPFFGPTMELLMIDYLARGHGVIIHACGIEFNGKGMMFAGESGAGKSTIANLWNQQAGAEVLSDDRTLVRLIDGKLWMFGTPWHGEAKFGSPKGIPLEKIFFLRHSPKNAIQPSPVTQSVLKLLQSSFPPYWDAAGMEYTMAFFEKLATRISCRELSFRPDGSIIRFINALDA